MAIDPDLFASVVEALDAAHEELSTLADGTHDWPVPDGLQKMLDEREALIATMRRACQGMTANGKPHHAERLRAIYREELATAQSLYEMPAAPVLPEVVAAVEAVQEDVRRRALVDGDVRDALQARMAV